MNIKSVAAGFFASILFSGCVTTAPKTGWIQRDASTNKGIYVYSDGSRYEGGYLGDKFHGNGSFFYNYKYYGDYPSTTDAPQIDGATSSAKFNNGSIDGESITFTSNSEAQNNKVSPDSFKYVGGYSKGFKGAGTVTFGNGRVVKGQFDNESVPYTIAPNDRIIFKSSNLIGSYFEGPVSVKWPNGATFEGNSYRYYLFDRSSGMSNPNNLSCISSVFFGYGTLRSPGQPNYVGIVSEDYATYLPRRAREADLVRYAEELSECPSILAAARKSITNAQANYDAEMAQGREQARASLARDLSKLSVNINNDMRRVESASRGSTVELDREKARLNTVFNEGRSRTTSNNKSSGDLKSTISKNRSSISSAPIDQPDTSQKLNKAESKNLFPFSKSVTYQSTYGSKGKEQALETVITERKNSEPHFLAFAATWSVVSVSSPTCAASEHGLERGHWVCKVTVMYKGESTTNPNSSSAGVTRVQGR